MRSKEKVQRLIYEILSILKERKHEGPQGARVIAKELKNRGFDIGERAVRYHLKHLDDKGFTKKPGSFKGRIITERGEEEVRNDLVGERVGFVIGRIEELIYKMSYDLESRKGEIVANISFLDSEDFEEAIITMQKVMEAGYSPSPLVKVSGEGEKIGHDEVPEGKVGVATVCSVTIDGLLAGEGIPVSPKFGGLIEIEDGEPRRFVDAISYRGSSLDPLEVFASKKMTSILNVLDTGSGLVLANLRSIPISARTPALDLIKRAGEANFDGVMDVGAPAESLYGLPVEVNQVGLVVVGGMNPTVAVEEKDIEIETKPLELLLDISEMRHVREYV